jgi:hypothetical protein
VAQFTNSRRKVVLWLVVVLWWVIALVLLLFGPAAGGSTEKGVQLWLFHAGRYGTGGRSPRRRPRGPWYMEQNIQGRLMLFYDTTLGWQCYNYLFLSPVVGSMGGNTSRLRSAIVPRLVTWRWHRERAERVFRFSDGGRRNHHLWRRLWCRSCSMGCLPRSVS